MTDQHAEHVRVEEPWFDCRDYPVLVHPWPPPMPHTATSESGMTIELDRDRDHERCDKRDPLRDVFCIMPKGHDTPHMPMSYGIAREIGPFIVRSISRSSALTDGQEASDER